MILQALMLCALMAEPIHVGGNFSRDLFGAVDTRPNTWGRADADTLPIQFNPPPGYKVNILALRGDLIAFPKIDKPAPVPVVTPLPVAPLIAPNRYAGVLMGFSLTGPEGSKLCTWCADGTIVYIQDSISTAKDTTRAGFNYDKLDVTLGPDNTLQLKLAAWLNTMEVPIHVEGSWTADLEFVPVEMPRDLSGPLGRWTKLWVSDPRTITPTTGITNNCWLSADGRAHSPLPEYKSYPLCRDAR